jgi:hypothetical protein
MIGDAPALPRSIYAPSTAGGLAFVGAAVAMFALPALGAAWVVDTALPAAVRALAVLLLALVGQQGLHLLGWVGHEGFHLNLHRNKMVSALLGTCASSMVFSFAQVGVAITHALHHRHTNGPEDPDLQLFSPHQTLWRRLLFGRLAVNRVFLANTIRLAFGWPLPVSVVVPFRPRQLRVLACVNLLCSSAFMAAYAWAVVVSPLRALAAIALPHLLAIALSGLRPLPGARRVRRSDRSGTRAATRRRSTRGSSTATTFISSITCTRPCRATACRRCTGASSRRATTFGAAPSSRRRSGARSRTRPGALAIRFRGLGPRRHERAPQPALDRVDVVTAAHTRARDAFASGTTRPPAARLERLRALDAALVRHEPEIFAALAADLGRPPYEAYGGEIGVLRAEIHQARRSLARWMKPERVHLPLRFCRGARAGDRSRAAPF